MRASIAKYNNLMSVPIATEGGEVGIPASMADAYYQKSLDASEEIIKHGPYELYNKDSDKGKNFYDMLMVKDGNKEIIFAKDYIASLKVHRFAYDNIVRHLTEDNESSSTISPSLGLVESFDYLDGSKRNIKSIRIKTTTMLYTIKLLIFLKEKMHGYMVLWFIRVLLSEGLLWKFKQESLYGETVIMN